MKVTINRIAEVAGVSRGTVDRVLNNRGRVRPEVAERVEAIAAELGYVPVKHKKPIGKKSFRLGIITILSESSFMEEIHKGIARAAEELAQFGIEVLWRESAGVNEAEQLRYIDELHSDGISGLAIMPVNGEGVRNKLTELTTIHKMPVITFNTDIRGTMRKCFIGIDNWRSGATAAGLMHMICGEGSSILLITGHFANALSNSRVNGFIDTVKKDFPGMKISGVHCSFDDPREVEKIILEHCNEQNMIGGLFVVSGGQDGIVSAFKKINAARRPAVIVYDRTPCNLQALEDGIIDIMIDQNTFMQGYQTVHTLSSLVTGGQPPEQEFLYTEINIKTKYNL